MTASSKHIDQLRQEVWRIAVGTQEIEHALHYYDQIRHRIGEATGNHFHRDTIRNFFEGHHSPRPRTLDIYSTFVLGGDEDHPCTFQEFIQSREQEGAAPPPRRKTHRHRNALIFLLGVPALLLAGFFLIFPPAGSEAIDHSIAVLPFRGIGDQENQQYYADGISEAIINHLAGIDELLVISRTSVEQYRQTTKTIPEIAAELGVGYVLEGSVQRSGDQLRITVQLIDGRTDRHRWAKNYDRTAADIFSVQQDIARSVARTLQLEGQARLQRQPTDNLEAYDNYLRGQRAFLATSAFIAGTRDSLLLKADSLFRRALALDPSFAQAHIGRAKVYFTAAWNLETQFDSALIHCNRALEINPDIADAYVERGWFYLANNQYKEAKEDLLRAVALNANHPIAYQRLSRIYLHEKDYIQAYRSLNKALLLEHSPESLREIYGSIFISFYEIGDFERSEMYLNRLLTLAPEQPGSAGARGAQIWFYMITGKFQEALRIGEQFLSPKKEGVFRTLGELNLHAGNYQKSIEYFTKDKQLVNKEGYRSPSEVPFYAFRFGQALYLCGRKNEGIQLIKKVIAKMEQAGNSSDGPNPYYYDLAGNYAFLGDKERALNLLRQERDWFNGFAFFIQHDLQYDNLRDEPEFQEILRRVHEEKRRIREAVDSVGRAEGWVL